MLQVSVKVDQNSISFLLQNWSKFDQKSIKKLYWIQSWFWKRFFFSIFGRILTNFGPILGPKWAGFWRGNGVWTRSRPQTRVQRPSGPIFFRFLIDFWQILIIFWQILDNFLINFEENLNTLAYEHCNCDFNIHVDARYPRIRMLYLRLHFSLEVGGMA